MESQIAPVTAPVAQPQPVLQADTRPSADVASVAKNVLPHIPLPVPASLGPVGEVNKSRISTTAADPDIPVERTLKPYGVSMLPYTPPEGAMDKSKV